MAVGRTYYLVSASGIDDAWVSLLRGVCTLLLSCWVLVMVLSEGVSRFLGALNGTESDVECCPKRGTGALVLRLVPAEDCLGFVRG